MRSSVFSLGDAFIAFYDKNPDGGIWVSKANFVNLKRKAGVLTNIKLVKPGGLQQVFGVPSPG